jgi:hypothetical protein
MAITNCVICKTREVYIKKRSMCKLCYGRERSKGRITPGFIEPPFTGESNSEMDFIKNYFRHSNWVYQPATFFIGSTTYRPDFYDGLTGYFIEVISTRQAYDANKHKYNLFRTTFPALNFEIRKTDGSILNEDDKKLDWSGTAQSDKFILEDSFCNQ